MRLEVEDLCITYSRSGRVVEAVHNVSLVVEAGRTFGIVGESGSGKSSLGLAIMRLLPAGTKTTGRILLDGEDLLSCSEKRMRHVRGPRVGMVFQDSLAALNPVFPIRTQIVETMRRHDRQLSRRDARVRAAEALEELAIPRERLRSYPHEFSGGMRQRAMIATALAAGPTFLIADEATSELDTSSQRQVLDVLAGVQKARELGLIVISHDLGVIHHACQDVAVMYRGDLVEFGRTAEVLSAPKHWYTKALVRISAKKRDDGGRLYTIRDSPEWEAARRDDQP
jgi:ABC-type dipeptide/oligopeptide/nickel transport system ATPase component